MKKRIVLVIATIFLFKLQIIAQSFKEHRGDIFFDKFNFQKAVALYQQAVSKEPLNNELVRKIADCYKLLEKDSLSSIWYGKLYDSGKADSTDLMNYYIVLKNDGQYDKASDILRQIPSTQDAGKFLLSKQFADELKSKTYRYNITLVNQSSKYSDFSPAYFGDKIIFVSSRQGSGIINRTYPLNGQPFLQLFIADTLANGQLTNIKEFSDKINTRYHEGPLYYCTSDSTMYFTRNNFNGYKKLSSDGKLNLKIYTAQFTFNEWLKSVENMVDSMGIKAKFATKNWRNIREFKYNSDEYSMGHPTLSKDGKRIYFVSDMPGGKGGTDIYMCERDDKGDWGKPINLSELNTKGNEMFPFIHPSGVLFFASDGLPGLGGLDIFKAEPKGDRFGKPENMGAPLNSSNDDFGLIADNSTKTGYFSSNRPNGVGSDDLYFVRFSNIRYVNVAIKVVDKENGQRIGDANINVVKTKDNSTFKLANKYFGVYSTSADSKETFAVKAEKEGYQPYSEIINLENKEPVNDTISISVPLLKTVFYGVYGTVFINETKENVPDVNISFEPIGGGQPVVINSDTNGEFRTLLAEKTNYEIVITKKNFFTLKDKYTTAGKTPGWINLNEFINLNIEKIDMSKTIEIPNIYYDLGKWNIRKDAVVELDKVVTLLNDNPTIKIELGSHTDSRGDANSNQVLSQKRAQSAVDYIISKGISNDRIVAKGYGESKLKNRCADGVKCSEKEHQENRRTEIRVTSF